MSIDIQEREEAREGRHKEREQRIARAAEEKQKNKNAELLIGQGLLTAVNSLVSSITEEKKKKKKK